MDWRLGAEWFENKLLDYDCSANWGNWVAAAGMTGGRVNKFNIAKQTKDYDPEGEYIKYWVPELRKVPAKYIAEPRQMPDVAQSAGCVIGVDYPARSGYRRAGSSPPLRRRWGARKRWQGVAVGVDEAAVTGAVAAVRTTAVQAAPAGCGRLRLEIIAFFYDKYKQVCE